MSTGSVLTAGQRRDVLLDRVVSDSLAGRVVARVESAESPAGVVDRVHVWFTDGSRVSFTAAGVLAGERDYRVGLDVEVMEPNS